MTHSMATFRQRDLRPLDQRPDQGRWHGAAHDYPALCGLVGVQRLHQHPTRHADEIRPELHFATVYQLTSNQYRLGKVRRLDQSAHVGSLEVAARTAISDCSALHSIESGHVCDGQMTVSALVSITPTADRPAQITDKRSCHNGRHSSAHHDTPLGTVGSNLKIYPPDQPDNVVPDLQVDAFDKPAINNFRLRQMGWVNQLGHTPSPFSGAPA